MCFMLFVTLKQSFFISQMYFSESFHERFNHTCLMFFVAFSQVDIQSTGLIFGPWQKKDKTSTFIHHECSLFCT